MREVLDRLREAETALDNYLRELYCPVLTSRRAWTIDRLWNAKRYLWYTQMSALSAASGSETPEPQEDIG